MSSIDIDPSLDGKAADLTEHEGEEDNRMFGFIVFLLSESIIFFSLLCWLHSL